MTKSTVAVHAQHDNALLLVLALAAAPAIGLGIARFAYALLLPDMRSDLAWSWAEAGWMNTSNALGYLGGAMLAARAIERRGAGMTMMSGAFVCVLSLVFCALLAHPLLLNAARVLAGLGGGFAFVAGGVLAASVASRDATRSAFLLGLYYAGAGLGIALSGVVVPVTLALAGPGSWPLAWGILALVSGILGVALVHGRNADPGRHAQSVAAVRLLSMRLLMISYCLFGAGYIAYMTFMVAWVFEAGGSVVQQSLLWIVIGLAAMASPWLWAGVLGTFRHGNAFALLCMITALGCALPLVLDRPWVLLLSGAVFGSAFFSVVASTTAFVRRNYSEPGWGKAIGALTVAFGAGQMLGPVAIGMLNDATGGLRSGLVMSSVLLALSAGVALRQRDA